MSGVRQNDRGGNEPEVVPPFWLRTEEHGIEIIEERVRAVAEENWHWAFWLVKRNLHDSACAAELVERVAIEVTNRLRADAAVGRNLSGYFRTSIIRRVNTMAVRNSRIAYEGGPQDLEANHRPSAPDWMEACEDRITIRSLLPYMSHPVRRMLHYRLLDYSWKHIAQEIGGLSEQQAKKRFYYGVRQAYDALCADQASRPCNEESE